MKRVISNELRVILLGPWFPKAAQVSSEMDETPSNYYVIVCQARGWPKLWLTQGQTAPSSFDSAIFLATKTETCPKLIPQDVVY